MTDNYGLKGSLAGGGPGGASFVGGSGNSSPPPGPPKKKKKPWIAAIAAVLAVIGLFILHRAVSKDTCDGLPAPSSAITGDDIVMMIYRDGLTPTSNGVLAKVDLLSYIEYDDAYIRNLGVGDAIDVSAYGYGIMRIQSIYDDCILLESGAGSLYRSEYTGWNWRLVYPSDISYTYVSGSAEILFDADSKITDCLIPRAFGASPEELDSITEFFDRADDYGYHTEGEKAIVSLDQGVVTTATIPYHP